MADNSAQNGTDTIATDELTTLNGGAVSGFKVQRVKVGFGPDATLRDVDTGFGLPIQGDTAAAATDAGAPIKIGGIGKASNLTAVTDGQRQNLWLGLGGQTMVGCFANAGSDGSADFLGYLLGSGGGLVPLDVAPRVYNGSTYDRLRGDTTGVFTKQVNSLRATVSTDIPTAMADGVLGDVWLGSYGQVIIGSTVSTPADGGANSLNYFPTQNGSQWPLATGGFVFNGTTWDRQRGDSTATFVKQVGALPTGTNTIGTTTGPTLTKGTQGTTGYAVQDLKDSGRTLFSACTVIGGVTAVTTEALVTLTPTRAGVAGTAATSHAVTSGKTLRINKIMISSRSTSAAVLAARAALRMNPSGAATATSPIIDLFSLTQRAAALAEAGDTIVITYPEGLEFSGTQQFGISQIASAVTGSIYISVVGYEY